MTSFIHLHLHSEYSLVDSIITIKPLIEKVKKLNMPAVAITDACNIFAAIKFYKAAVNAGIKPLLGADVYIKKDDEISGLTLMCQSKIGYHNLCTLIAKAYCEGQEQHKVIIQEQWLQQYHQDLIAILPMQASLVSKALNKKDLSSAHKKIANWQTLFNDKLYLEITRTQKPGEEVLLQSVLDFAEIAQLPVIASNNTRFLERSDFEAHEARVCIHRGEILNNAKRKRLYSEEQYLKPTEEMYELFSDIPEALQNTVEIAKRCNFEFRFGETFLPDFPTPENMPLDQFIDQSAHKGLLERLKHIKPNKDESIGELKQRYQQRLDRELEVIKKMGYPGYFLIVADFIKWSKQNKIPVGPGRGSGAGSLVAYSLFITDIDPLQYELLFERFLNSKRVSMPDFDIDFCMEGRDRVIEYVAQKYGRESVSQIITFGTMAAKAVVRDVGRVLNHPYGFVDRIAKMIPFEIGMTLEKALAEPALKEYYQADEEVRTIIDLAKKLEGIARNAGKHAGGVVIAPGKLTDFTAVYCEQGSNQIVSQFDKDDIETVGLVKFDFLGLRTLTIIDWALQTINKRLQQSKQDIIEIENIPLNDKKTFTLLQACHTTAVFQLESRGMKDLIKRLQPDCFEDIIALVALFRPGPLQSGMVDDFINRKHGLAKVVYPHPLLQPILEQTYGVILYQEQVMQIAQDLAGYTLGAADILRRAMGKKKFEEMAHQREIFVSGAVKNNIDKKIAEHIFDLMEKFAGYGFNKSHSAAYALIAYQTAWLKTHFTAEFMAAVLSSDMDNTDKVVNFIEDCKHLNITVSPPDINNSQYKFIAVGEHEILFGLGAIKGVGESAIDIILAQRENNLFKNFYDLCHRVESRKVTKRVFEALIKSGCLDMLGPYRASLLDSLPKFLHAADQHEKNIALNQDDLFGDHADDDKHHLEPDFNETERWQQRLRLQFEKETLGFYLSGHPFAQCEKEALQFITSPLKKIGRHQGQTVVVSGLMNSVRTIKTKRGDRMAAISIDDGLARLDAIAFSSVFEKQRDLFKVDTLIVASGEISVDNFTENYRLTINEIYSLESYRQQRARFLQINLLKKACTPQLIKQLKNLLQRYSGPINVCIHYQNESAKTQLPLGDEWKIKPSDQLIETLQHDLDINAEFIY